MSEWQPIETAPRDGTKVLIAGEGCVDIGWWHEDRGRILIAEDTPYWEDYDNSYWDRCEIADNWFQPTHWMPLPAPPVV